MKNILRIVIIIILVFIGLKLIFPSKYGDKLKEVSFDKDANIIINFTDNKSLDTIYHVGLEVLGIKGKKFVIREIQDNVKTGYKDELILIGSVVKYKEYYLIYTKLTNNKKMIDIASHELIHVKQYMDNRLEVTPKNLRWENKFYTLPLTVSYEDAPWEIEAFDKAKEFKDLMYNSLLVKK